MKVLKTPVAINYQHQVLLENYTSTVLDTVSQCTGRNQAKYNDFLDVMNIIIDHHNQYRKGTDIGNLYDFLSIIPTNMSIAIQGFLAGLETKRNAVTLRAYRYMLTNAAFKLVSDLEQIQLENE